MTAEKKKVYGNMRIMAIQGRELLCGNENFVVLIAALLYDRKFDK